ncbi:hypothetical protein TA3x_000392 [Tundrisphaera sp. TA3]|uniref:hypothetical protein n=1 Tax=Tundrisphaera sp. TA3 TaxID=3435775 RepID=UPI003EBC1145
MWQFAIPYPDHTAFVVSYQARNLAEAFQRFAEESWRQEIGGTVGVWRNGLLVARVIVFTNRKTKEREPHLQLWR